MLAVTLTLQAALVPAQGCQICCLSVRVWVFRLKRSRLQGLCLKGFGLPDFEGLGLQGSRTCG